MSEKLWGGRFGRPTARIVERFTSSVEFDRILAAYDVAGSIAHARMLGRTGIIKKGEAAKIVRGLRTIAGRIDSGKFRFSKRLEDVHTNVEAALRALVGPVAGKLHSGRSRNDQVALDLRLWVRDAVGVARGLVAGLQGELLGQAERHRGDVLPGMTHLQPAQPVLLGHWLLAYVERLGRDEERLAGTLARVNVSPLGAGALAGTTLPIDRRYAAKLLGFPRVAANSLDAVGDRDFAVEYVFALSMIAAHLSQMAEDMVLWSSAPFGFAELPDEFATGSSIMPQKKNPDVLELIRAKAARVYGNLATLLVLLKGLPMAYNRDLQEDKEAVFGAHATVCACLEAAAATVGSMRFDPKAMRRALDGGFLEATALAEYLVGKGLPFREAHKAVGGLVRRSLARGRSLRELTLPELVSASKLFKPDVARILTPDGVIARYRSEGSSSPASVGRQIARWKRLLKKRA